MNEPNNQSKWKIFIKIIRLNDQSIFRTDHSSINPLVFYLDIVKYRTSFINKARMRTCIQNTNIGFFIDQFLRHSMIKYKGISCHSIQTIRIDYSNIKSNIHPSEKNLTHSSASDMIRMIDLLEELFRFQDSSCFTLMKSPN